MDESIQSGHPELDVSDCPRWCATNHQISTLPEDNTHESEGHLVPALVRGKTGHAVADDVAVYIEQQPGHAIAYLVLSTGPGNEFAIALSHASSVLSAAAEALTTTTAGDIPELRRSPHKHSE